MAGAIKHMERSHRSHRNKTNYSQFERNARTKAYTKENKSFLSKLFGMFKRGDK